MSQGGGVGQSPLSNAFSQAASGGATGFVGGGGQAMQNGNSKGGQSMAGMLPQVPQAPQNQAYGVNPYGQASQGMQQAFNTVNQNLLQSNNSPYLGQYNPAMAQAQMRNNPAQAGTQQAAARGYNAAIQGGPDAIYQQMGNYKNPYQQQVINRTTNQMNKQLGQMQEVNRANAAAAGAFGGARHGLTEATTNAEVNQQIGDMAAGLNMQGFNTAAGLAGQDIGNQMNVAAQNQASRNMARQFGAGAQNQNSMFNAQQGNQMNQFNTGIRDAMRATNQSYANQFGLANQNAQNQAGQFNASQRLNQQGQQFNQGMEGARLLGQLSNQAFNTGNAVSGNQINSGQMTQGMNQNLMDMAQQMFGQYASQPSNILQMRLASLGMNPMNNATTTTTQQQPGWGTMLGNLIGAAGNMFSFSPIKFGG